MTSKLIKIFFIVTISTLSCYSSFSMGEELTLGDEIAELEAEISKRLEDAERDNHSTALDDVDTIYFIHHITENDPPQTDIQIVDTQVGFSSSGASTITERSTPGFSNPWNPEEYLADQSIGSKFTPITPGLIWASEAHLRDILNQKLISFNTIDPETPEQEWLLSTLLAEENLGEPGLAHPSEEEIHEKTPFNVEDAYELLEDDPKLLPEIEQIRDKEAHDERLEKEQEKFEEEQEVELFPELEKIKEEIKEFPIEKDSAEILPQPEFQPTLPQHVDEKKTLETPNEPAGKEKTYLLKFNNVKMSAILQVVSQMTGKNFIFDEKDLDFSVTIISNKPTTVENIVAALLQELRIRGLSLIEVGNNLIIHDSDTANSPARIITEDDPTPQDAELVTQVFQLENTDPEILVGVIEPMLSANALVEAVPNSRHLIITDLTTNIEKIRILIKNIDTPSSQFEIGRYSVRNAPAEAVANLAQKIIEPIAAGQPFVLVPHPATNSVYVVSTRGVVNRAIQVMRSIDQDEAETQILSLDRLSLEDILDEARGTPPRDRRRERQFQEASLPLGSVEATKFSIYKLQYRKGFEIQNALENVAESLELTLDENTDLITTIDSVQYIEATNSLIFTGTAVSIKKVRNLIEQIDIPVKQVLIEVLLIETNIQDSLAYGTDWGARLTDTCEGASEAFIRSDSPLVGGLDNTAPGFPTVDASGLARTTGFNWGVIGRNVSRNGISFDSIGALVSAIHNDQQIDLLLNPKILVEDNATAEVFVGINTAFQTQSIANDEGSIITGSVEFRDVGSSLKVTPIIGDNGIVTLELEQENSSAAQSPISQDTGGTTTTGGQTVTTTSQTQGVTDFGPTTRKTTTTTRIHVPDKYFVILSGQIRDEVTFDRQQVPCLGGLPFLGAVFSRTATLVEKRNQMLFLRPIIIENHDINRETKRQQDLFHEHNRNPKRWQYEVDKALDWLNVDEPYCDPERKHPIAY